MTPEEWLVALGGSSRSGDGTLTFRTMKELEAWKASRNGSR